MDDPAVAKVGYTYTLGYMGPRGVVGVRRADAVGGAADWEPITADLPAKTAGTGPHGRGRSGNLRYCAKQ